MLHLFSTVTGLPDVYFQGYAFSDADFVSGERGAKEYFKETGKRVSEGSDGCYLSIRRDGERHIIGVDGAGLMKIFWYRDHKFWAFSNSIQALAAHLRDNGISVRHSPAQLAALRSPLVTLTEQLASFETMFKGIRMLPANLRIEVSSGGISLRPLHRNPSHDYAEDLSQAIEIWLRRIETFLIDPRIRISCDLTGGKDSRVLFALLHMAKKRIGKNVAADVVVNSSIAPHLAKDFAAASLIADTFGVILNPKPKPVESTNLSVGVVYNQWKDLNIGVYAPIYFPSRVRSSFSVNLHGGGGENHRKFYKYKGLCGFAEDLLTDGANDPLLREWVDSIRSCLICLKNEAPEVDLWISHYRAFRSRLHAGLLPQYRTIIQPFNSVLMSSLSDIEGKASASQIHFDIMENLFPGLAALPYDQPSKAPSEVAIGAFTKVDISEQGAAGRAYISEDIRECNDALSGWTPFDLLKQDFDAAIRLGVEGIMPEMVSQARIAMAKASEKKAFAHAVEGRTVSRVISASVAIDKL